LEEQDGVGDSMYMVPYNHVIHSSGPVVMLATQISPMCGKANKVPEFLPDVVRNGGILADGEAQERMK
jgi:hypothetical protein